MKASIPAGLAISEDLRLLSYLKVKYQAGYFNKGDLSTLARRYGKDLRTLKSLLNNLLKSALIGEDTEAYYLRSWKFITGSQQFNQQSFKATLSDIRDKGIFEAKLFSAKITSIQKTFRRGGRVREQGFTHQSPSTGLLSKMCKISQGKVSELKRKAVAQGFIKVEKLLHDHGPGTVQTAMILSREMPGIFLKEGRLKRRQTDQITSAIETFRIKNRRVRVRSGINKTLKIGSKTMLLKTDNPIGRL